MTISVALQALLAGEPVAGSRLSPKLADELLAAGLLTVRTRGSRQSYRAIDTQALRQYLMDKDEAYRLLYNEGTASRAAMAHSTGNSKLLSVRSCPGFPINSYEPITCTLNGTPWVVHPQEGSFLFVTAWTHFLVPSDVLIIGIENMDNFVRIRQQRAFFDEYLKAHALPTKVLFVARYPQSTDLRQWLSSIPNPYLHFGDFDLAGIHIFLSEFQQYLGTARAAFLIPSDIAERLRGGSQQRYDEQCARFRHLHTDTPDLQQLIATIHRERRGYDQEGYILDAR